MSDVQEFPICIDGRKGIAECSVDEAEVVPISITLDPIEDGDPYKTIDRHDSEWRHYVDRIDMRWIEEIIQDRESNGGF